MKYKINIVISDSIDRETLVEFLSEYRICVCDEAKVTVIAEKGERLSVSGTFENVKITYNETNQLFRALSHLPRFLENGLPVFENAKYKMLCYMADNSRNAVYNMSSAKRMMRYLAAMGYDSMMLYTEDTYELEGYPYFGHMRGRFTEQELRELDEYAYKLGLTLIPCVQTLAHLATALRWPDFDGYKDNDEILLVGDERTYKFVEAVLKQCKKCFRTDMINLGMDEAHFIACGTYLKKNGYRKPSDVMLEHLNKVVDMCERIGYKPMIWSDMFFRMQFDGIYRVDEGEITPEVIAKVPQKLDLVYWDYYSMNEKMFSHMLDCHAKFNNPIIFAGGAWKWYGFGAHNKYSLRSTEMQLNLCEQNGIDRIIVTSWGDNGGEASQFSTLASMLYYAERNYRNTVEVEWLEMRSADCFDTTFTDMLAFDAPDELTGAIPSKNDRPCNPSKYLLYNDLFERFMDCHIDIKNVSSDFAKSARRLMALKDNCNFGYAFETLGYMCEVLSLKCDMGHRIYNAYNSNDKQALSYIANEQIPQMIKYFEKFISAFREQWYKENKTFGFITQEIRLGGLKERICSCQDRLIKYINGEIDRIEELEYEALPVKPEKDGEYINFNAWNKIVAAGIL